MSLRNERDNFVQSTPPRLLATGLPGNVNVPGLKALLLSTSATAFKVNAEGEVVGPTQIIIRAIPRAIQGEAVFSVTFGTATLIEGANDNEKIITFDNMESDIVRVQVSITDETTFRPTGVEPLDIYTETVSISKVQDGTIGSRGAGHYYAAGSSWSDTTATNAVPEASPIVDDLVTISNGTNYALTRRWDGAAWVNIGTVLDGNLLVTGSVNSAKINTNGLTIRDPWGNIILDAGGGVALDYTKVGGSKPPSNATNGATIGVNLGGQITSSNASTYIANAAIGNAHIASLSADKLSAGTITGVTIQISSPSLGWLFNAGTNGTEVGYRRLGGYNIDATNLANPGSAAVYGRAVSGSNAEGVMGGHLGSGHGVRGNGGGSGAGRGLVGVGNGMAFFAEAGGYGPFTGVHDTLFPTSEFPNIELGDILCDQEIVGTMGVDDAIGITVRSNTTYSKTCIGVFTNTPNCLLSDRPINMLPNPLIAERTSITEFDDDDKPYTYDHCTPTQWYLDNKEDYYLGIMNSVGEGLINVCGEGGDIAIGDYIVSSSIPGKGMKQSDDVYRNYTVAKSRENVTFSSSTEVKQIACIYLCG